MTLPFEDTTLKRQALAYVIELYHELTEENGAPTLGTQNQAVDFILADPELRHAVAAWAETTEIDEATTAPPRRSTARSRPASTSRAANAPSSATRVSSSWSRTTI